MNKLFLHLVLGFLVCFMVACSSGNFLHEAAETNVNQKYWVSIIELIANPERYNDKEVIVKGFLCIESENQALYLHNEDYENRLGKNSVALDNPGAGDAKRWHKKYVTVEGTFKAVERNRRFAWSGFITKITRITPTIR